MVCPDFRYVRYFSVFDNSHKRGSTPRSPLSFEVSYNRDRLSNQDHSSTYVDCDFIIVRSILLEQGCIFSYYSTRCFPLPHNFNMLLHKNIYNRSPPAKKDPVSTTSDKLPKRELAYHLKYAAIEKECHEFFSVLYCDSTLLLANVDVFVTVSLGKKLAKRVEFRNHAGFHELIHKPVFVLLANAWPQSFGGEDSKKTVL